MRSEKLHAQTFKWIFVHFAVFGIALMWGDQHPLSPMGTGYSLLWRGGRDEKNIGQKLNYIKMHYNRVFFGLKMINHWIISVNYFATPSESDVLLPVQNWVLRMSNSGPWLLILWASIAFHALISVAHRALAMEFTDVMNGVWQGHILYLWWMWSDVIMSGVLATTWNIFEEK